MSGVPHPPLVPTWLAGAPVGVGWELGWEAGYKAALRAAAEQTFGAVVQDAGGGMVDLLVDRDTARYPTVGSHVTVAFDG